MYIQFSLAEFADWTKLRGLAWSVCSYNASILHVGKVILRCVLK